MWPAVGLHFDHIDMIDQWNRVLRYTILEVYKGSRRTISLDIQFATFLLKRKSLPFIS